MRLTVNKTLKKLGAMLLALCLVLGGFPPLQQSAQAASANSVKMIQIAAARDNSIALKSDGTVIAWGNNITSWTKPPEGLTGVVEIYAKDTVFLARKSNGTVVGWGNNQYGKATPPAGLTDVIAVSAGEKHSLALKSDGTVVSWSLQTSVPGDDKLSSLTISGGELSPAFSPTGESYHVDIAETTSTVRINAVLTDTAYTALYINDQLQISGTDVAVSVPPAGTVVTVRVEPYMKPSRTYTITLSRDRTPPVIQFTPNGNANPLRGIDTIVQVTDATSGVKESALEYVWTQSEEEPGSGWAPFSLLPHTQYSPFGHNGADGKWYLHIRAGDYAGHSAYARSEPFLIDNTPPVLNVQ